MKFKEYKEILKRNFEQDSMIYKFYKWINELNKKKKKV